MRVSGYGVVSGGTSTTRACVPWAWRWADSRRVRCTRPSTCGRTGDRRGVWARGRARLATGRRGASRPSPGAMLEGRVGRKHMPSGTGEGCQGMWAVWARAALVGVVAVRAWTACQGQGAGGCVGRRFQTRMGRRRLGRRGRGRRWAWERRRSRMQAVPAGPAGGRVRGVVVRVECSDQGAGGCTGRPFRIPTETRRRGRPQRRPRRGLAWRVVRAMAPLAVGCTRSGRWCRGKRLWRRVRSGPRAGRRRRWQGRRAGRSARRRQRRCGIRMVGGVGWGARAGRREAGARVTN